MEIVWGVILVLVATIAWVGQLISWQAPSTAVRLGVMEADEDVEPVFAADVRGEAIWDSFTLWTLLAAGVLMLVGSDLWAYFGLVGGATYCYFAGRGIVTRRVMAARGHRVGSAQNVAAAYTMLVVWGTVGAFTIVAAALVLESG